MTDMTKKATNFFTLFFLEVGVRGEGELGLSVRSGVGSNEGRRGNVFNIYLPNLRRAESRF